MLYVAVFQEENSAVNNNNSNGAKPKLPYKRCLAATKDLHAITSTGPAQNSNNNCSSVSTQLIRPVITPAPVVSSVSAMMTAHGLPLRQASPCAHRQPVASASPAAVTRDSAIVGHLPSPLLPCPRSPTSTAGSSVTSLINQWQALVATSTSVINDTQPKQLPVYFMPQYHPNAVPQTTGYVPFCRPGFTVRPGNFQPVGMTHGGIFHNNVNAGQQMAVRMLQHNLSPSRPLTNVFPPPQGCNLSAPSGVNLPSLCPISNGRADVPLNFANSVAVASAVQPGLVMNGASPDALPGGCTSVNGMDFSLLQDAVKDEQAAFNVSRNLPANNFPSCSESYVMKPVSHPVETASAESDSSLSDWSIIELPSSPTTSSATAASQGETSVMKEIPVASLASLSLMHFSSDSGHTVASNTVCSGPVPVRAGQIQAQKLSTAFIPQPGSA